MIKCPREGMQGKATKLCKQKNFGSGMLWNIKGPKLKIDWNALETGGVQIVGNKQNFSSSQSAFPYPL